MTDEQKRESIAEKIRSRLREDERWARVDFTVAQVFTWLAILASFFSAILAAYDKVSPLLVALLAAVPGTVIVIDRSFSFARRARWHWELTVALDRLLNGLLYEDATVADTSRRLGELRQDMEARYPGLSLDGLAEGRAKSK